MRRYKDAKSRSLPPRKFATYQLVSSIGKEIIMTMRALVISRYNGPLELTETSMPEPARPGAGAHCRERP
jgi:hypothetical protein